MDAIYTRNANTHVTGTTVGSSNGIDVNIIGGSSSIGSVSNFPATVDTNYGTPGAADTDTGAVAANETAVNISYTIL